MSVVRKWVLHLLAHLQGPVAEMFLPPPEIMFLPSSR